MTNDEPLTLRDIAQRASDRHGGVRGRELDRIAKRAGLTLSYTTVDKILNGTYLSRPKRETLDALAKLSGMSQEDVYRAAGEPLPLAPLADQLPEGADMLSAEQRSLVIGMVHQFAAMNRELEKARGGEGNVRAPSIDQAGVSPASDPDIEQVNGDPLTLDQLDAPHETRGGPEPGDAHQG